MRQYELGRVYTFDEADSDLQAAMLRVRETFLSTFLPLGEGTESMIEECRKLTDSQLSAKYQGVWRDPQSDRVLFHQFTLHVPTHCSFMCTTFVVGP